VGEVNPEASVESASCVHPTGIGMGGRSCEQREREKCKGGQGVRAGKSVMLDVEDTGGPLAALPRRGVHPSGIDMGSRS